MEKNQDYFWRASFQKKMKESEKDIEEGKYIKFNSISECVDFLEKLIELKED